MTDDAADRRTSAVATYVPAIYLLIPILFLSIGVGHMYAQSRAELVGSWTLTGQRVEGITLTLLENGDGDFAGERFTWTSERNTLRMTSEDETITYTWRVRDGVLFLSGGDLEQEVRLVHTGARQQSGTGHTGGDTQASGGVENTQGGSSSNSDEHTFGMPDNEGANAAGGVAMDLVGKWCYMANVHTYDGGRMTDECVTLHADGTYEYYRESSSSGAYGSSASQESDAGTWSVQGNTLIANSRSSGRQQYSLERRNHPKNVNDPMIVIDGRAFVTATQRPAW